MDLKEKEEKYLKQLTIHSVLHLINDIVPMNGIFNDADIS